MIGKTISNSPALRDPEQRDKILAKLGEGGMGFVCKAENTLRAQPGSIPPCGMKFLPSSFMAGEAEKTRFIHEAQAAAKHVY